MPIEIERKFLVDHDKWNTFVYSNELNGMHCSQFYLAADPEKTVRVRRMGEKAYLTIKGKTQGISRAEFEYEIPVSDAQALTKAFGTASIEKKRYIVPHGDHQWEVDEFSGQNKGLIIAEIELKAEDETFEKPDWLGAEVSDDPRYFNVRLLEHPYSQW